MAALMQFRDLTQLAAPSQYAGPAGYNESMMEHAYRSFNPAMYSNNL